MKKTYNELVLWTACILLCLLAAVLVFWEPATVGLTFLQIILAAASFLGAIVTYSYTNAGQRQLNR